MGAQIIQSPKMVVLICPLRGDMKTQPDKYWNSNEPREFNMNEFMINIFGLYGNSCWNSVMDKMKYNIRSQSYDWQMIWRSQWIQIQFHSYSSYEWFCFNCTLLWMLPHGSKVYRNLKNGQWLSAFTILFSGYIVFIVIPKNTFNLNQACLKLNLFFFFVSF